MSAACGVVGCRLRPCLQVSFIVPQCHSVSAEEIHHTKISVAVLGYTVVVGGKRGTGAWFGWLTMQLMYSQMIMFHFNYSSLTLPLCDV